jgi:hypothetical protein
LNVDTKVDPEAYRAALQEATTTWSKTVAEGFASLQDKFDKAVSNLGQAVTAALPSARAQVDPKPILDAFRGALERCAQQAPPQRESPPPPDTRAELESDIVAFVDKHGGEQGRGARFNELMDHLRPKYPALSVGQFHDVLRTLHQTKRIALGGWDASTDDLPDPSLAFYNSTQLVYHANPAHWYG